MAKSILSPITKNTNVNYIKSIDVKWIINQWKIKYFYDVSYMFSDIKKLDLFICNDSGYSFYHPVVMGDSLFYEYLQTLSWYYMPWKWEHMEAAKNLSNNINLLEIGCAEGHFIEKISSIYKLYAVGLEMNPKAIHRAKKKGITVYNETIEKHSLNNNQIYDVITCFQVLEHIADVDKFIRASINCLKSNGLFIISVPNNSSFISETEQILNMPPHHVGLWDDKSLSFIAKIYELELINIIYEPLQDYHYANFKSTVYRKVLGKRYENRFIRKIYNVFLLRPIVEKYLDIVKNWVKGHTILAIFKKPEKDNMLL